MQDDPEARVGAASRLRGNGCHEVACPPLGLQTSVPLDARGRGVGLPTASLPPAPPPGEAPPGVSLPRPGETLAEAYERARGARIVATLVVMDVAPRVTSFPAEYPARPDGHVSVLDPRYRARPAVEVAPSPPPTAVDVCDVTPLQLDAMRAREGRSVLEPSVAPPGRGGTPCIYPRGRP